MHVFSTEAAARLEGSESVRDLRVAAADRFAAANLPGPEEEIWRYSRIAELDLEAWRLAGAAGPTPAAQLRGLEEAFAAFLAALQGMTLVGLQQRTEGTYKAWPSCRDHFLGYHQTIHLAMHWGQIRTIRNLFKKTRGEVARFFPDNPSFPHGAAG